MLYFNLTMLQLTFNIFFRSQFWIYNWIEKTYLIWIIPWQFCVKEHLICLQILKDFLRECLRLADKFSKKTLAFHAMGTGGFLGYPKDVVASIMYGVIVEYDKSYSSTGIRDINFVLYNKDTETIRVSQSSITTQQRFPHLIPLILSHISRILMQ